jgi:hypothetical protein
MARIARLGYLSGVVSWNLPMTLTDWIARENLTQTEVAFRLGLSQGHVSDLCAGRFWPSRTIAAKIWRMTKGAVTPNDFLTDTERSEKPGRKTSS